MEKKIINSTAVTHVQKKKELERHCFDFQQRIKLNFPFLLYFMLKLQVNFSR